MVIFLKSEQDKVFHDFGNLKPFTLTITAISCEWQQKEYNVFRTSKQIERQDSIAEVQQLK
jgi:hypothetical protein